MEDIVVLDEAAVGREILFLVNKALDVDVSDARAGRHVQAEGAVTSAAACHEQVGVELAIDRRRDRRVNAFGGDVHVDDEIVVGEVRVGDINRLVYA